MLTPESLLGTMWQDTRLPDRFWRYVRCVNPMHLEPNTRYRGNGHRVCITCDKARKRLAYQNRTKE